MLIWLCICWCVWVCFCLSPILYQVLWCFTAVHQEDLAETEPCAVCREPMVSGDLVRRLPCAHLFHASCIARWLCVKATCPLDNSKVLETLQPRNETQAGGHLFLLEFWQVQGLYYSRSIWIVHIYIYIFGIFMQYIYISIYTLHKHSTPLSMEMFQLHKWYITHTHIYSRQTWIFQRVLFMDDKGYPKTP